MPQTFADSLNQFPIYADRAEKDQLGRNIVCTYATKDEVIGDVLPPLTDNAGKVLAVNQSENAVEWVPQGGSTGWVQADWDQTDPCEPDYILNHPTEMDISFGTGLTTTTSGSTVTVTADQELPSITGNAGKVLKVNSGATGVEWATESGGGGTTVVQADWNETDPSDPSYIQNHPTEMNIAFGTGLTVTTSGSTATVTADAATDKADKVPTATAGDLAAFDCYGNLMDSGIDSSDVAVYPSMSGNAGKVLKVNSGATGVEWATEQGTTYTAGNMINITSNQVGVSTTAGITDIQVVNALPASPVATVLYLIPLT